jgi:hypothetical protein
MAAPVSGLARITLLLTSWPVVLPSVLLSSAILTWCFAVRLKDNQRWLAVQARAYKPVEVVGKPITVAELADWREQARFGAAALNREPQEIAAILAELERKARELGWRVEVTLRPAIPRAGGFDDLTLHPAQFRLDDEADNVKPAYDRLLAWLRVVSTQSNRMEIASMHLRSAGAGLAGAHIDLQLFSYQTQAKAHEESSTK